jgi:hypothetical protein
VSGAADAVVQAACGVLLLAAGVATLSLPPALSAVALVAALDNLTDALSIASGWALLPASLNPVLEAASAVASVMALAVLAQYATYGELPLFLLLSSIFAMDIGISIREARGWSAGGRPAGDRKSVV